MSDNIQTLNYDLLILGGGLAGLHAALTASKSNYKVGMVSRATIGQSGASAIAMSVHRFAPTHKKLQAQHQQKVLDSAQGLADPALVDLLIREGAKHVLPLQQLRSDLSIKSYSEDGQEYPYFLAAPERKGIYISRLLRQQAQNQACIFWDNWAVLDLKYHDSQWRVFIEQNNQVQELTATAIVLATGGAVALYAQHSGTQDLCGNGLALALQLGLSLRDMECVQFYPFRIFSPSICDVFPDIFSYGACLRSLTGKRFMQSYPQKELENRDVLARAIAKHREVILDLTSCDLDRLKLDTPPLYKLYTNHPYEPLRIRIVTHHTMGGICIDPQTRTALPGLFACGEVVGGIHGANRLAGHALTDTAVFGFRAAQAALHYLAEFKPVSSSQLAPLPNWPQLGQDSIQILYQNLQALMWEYAGVIRHGEKLSQALPIIYELEQTRLKLKPKKLRAWINLGQMIMVAEAIIKSALLRKESRGAHFRADYPLNNPSYQKSIFYNLQEGAKFKT